jgi:hypothetical protein
MHGFFCHEGCIIVIDNMWIDVILETGCVTFNIACVFVVHDRSSAAFSLAYLDRSLVTTSLHSRFAGILALFCLVSCTYGLW